MDGNNSKSLILLHCKPKKDKRKKKKGKKNLRRFARSALQKKWDLFWKYKTVSLPKIGYNCTFVVKARFVHSIADGTYKMLNAHRIYLSAPRRTPKCTCTSVVAWQKKNLTYCSCRTLIFLSSALQVIATKYSSAFKQRLKSLKDETKV